MDNSPPAKIISLTKMSIMYGDQQQTMLIALCDDGRMYNQTISYRYSTGWELGKWYLHPTPNSLNTKP
jgi:hypothetical protein